MSSKNNSGHHNQKRKSWCCGQLSFIIILLGIRMHIMCLTRSTGKVRMNKMARLEVLSRRRTVLCQSCSQVSERSKSLRCWHTSHFLSPLFWHLSSFVEQLTVFHTSRLVLASSSILQVLDFGLHRDGIMSGMCRRGTKLCANPYTVCKPVYFNRKPVTDRHTNIHTYIQAQPQTKTPLAPVVLVRLSASC